MYIDKRIAKGTTYYYLRESYRDPDTGKVRKRTIVELGRHPTIEGAFREQEREYFESRASREGEPFTDADAKAWTRLIRLEREMLGPASGYRQSRRFAAEQSRWRAHMRERRYREFTRGLPPDRIALAREMLGVTPGATPDEIRAARDRMARLHHPDLGGDPDVMIRINEAYERLTE